MVAPLMFTFERGSPKIKNATGEHLPENIVECVKEILEIRPI